MALTDAGIKALKPRVARYMVSDGRGLSLDVLPSGIMSWLYRYRLDGKYGKVNLGRYPDLTLKTAREKRDGLAAKVASGKSPALEASGGALGISSIPLFRDFGERYYKEQVVQHWKDPKPFGAISTMRFFLRSEKRPLRTLTLWTCKRWFIASGTTGRFAAAMQLRNV